MSEVFAQAAGVLHRSGVCAKVDSYCQAWGAGVMRTRRVAFAASALAFVLMAPAKADEAAFFPPPPEPAETVFTAADALPSPAPAAPERDAAELVPQPPEPAAVIITLADADQPSAADREADIAVLLPAPPAPAEVTLDIAVLSTAEADLNPGADPAGELRLAEAFPPPPEAAPVVLDLAREAAPEPVQAAPVADRTSVASLPARQPLDEVGPLPELPAAPAVAPAAAAPAALDLAPLLAERLPAAVRHARLPEAEREGLIRFYAARGHRPLWVDAKGATPQGEALLARLARASEDGLRPADYATPAIGGDGSALAEADIRLSVAAVLYARDARGARIEPRRLSALITPRLELPSAQAVLAALEQARDAGEALAAHHPPHAGYRALRDRLAELRAAQPAAKAEPPRLPPGPTLRLGMQDPRVPLLRARFGLEAGEGRVYDRSLSTVVAEFQREKGLPANGLLTRATIEAMNGGRDRSLEGDLIATMERWRWLPADLGEEHIIVNVPEYVMRKVEGGAVVHESRVIVGKSERPTPIFSDAMDHLVLNPSWTVPPTILRKDFLPKMATDPDYAARRGLEVIRRGNNVTLRQPPGPTNALGNIKFMFPNDHAVYLHDTPNRNLFGSARRAYSSGCVRVERPLRLAELILSGEQGNWSEQRLRGLIGAGERTIRLSRRLPIHLVYMTHVVDAGGELRVHEDIYGFHRRTREALGL